MTNGRSPNRRHDVPLLSKYATAATARAVLETSCLRWSSPLLFNDPFDVPRQLEMPFTVDKLRRAITARFEAYLAGEAVPGSQAAFVILQDIARRQPEARDLMMGLLQDSMHLMTVPTEIGMQQFRDAWDEKVRHLRILCLSAIGDSAAMWAHYADNHRGVVLQFESSDERDSAFLLATPVIYRTEAPGLPLVDRWARAFLGEEEIDWDEYFHECYYVKGEEWGYEKEYRAISAELNDSRLYYDSPFFREDLRCVVLGAAIAPEDEGEIRRLVATYPQAALCRARHDQVARRIMVVPAD